MYKKIVLIYSILFFSINTCLAADFPVNITAAKSKQQLMIMDSFEIYGDAVKEILINYLEEIPINILLKNSVEGMLNELDPYAEFFDEQPNNELNVLSSGCYFGFGFSCKSINGNLTLINVRENTPASRAGLKIGDVIYAVDSTITINQPEFENSFLNNKNSNINFRIIRYDSNDTVNVKISKDTIFVPSISVTKLFDNDLGYIRIEQFTSKSFIEFSNAYFDLQKQTKSPQINGLIIDLRGNGGGILQEAIKICQMFVPKGSTIVSTKGKRHDYFQQEFISSSNPIDTTIPIVILINEGSASASEVVAGCLQDLDRAVIIGNTSFGKGLVQEIFPISHSRAIKLTTAKYYTPSGRCIQKINYSKNNDLTNEPHPIFYTKNGRKVFEQNGIKPDYIVVDDTISNVLAKSILENELLFNFTSSYFANSQIDKNNYLMNDNIYQNFIEYVTARNNFIKLKNIAILNSLKNNEKSENSKKILNDAINSLENEYRAILTNDAVCKRELSKQIDYSIKSRILSENEFFEDIILNDIVIKEALFIFSNGKYKNFLARVPAANN